MLLSLHRLIFLSDILQIDVDFCLDAILSVLLGLSIEFTIEFHLIELCLYVGQSDYLCYLQLLQPCF